LVHNITTDFFQSRPLFERTEIWFIFSLMKNVYAQNDLVKTCIRSEERVLHFTR